MADFHVKDTYGTNFKIGGSASGIYNLPIYKLFSIGQIPISIGETITTNTTKSYSQSILPNLTLNNATYIPISITGIQLDAEPGIVICDYYYNSNDGFNLRIRNTSSSSQILSSVMIYYLTACAKVPWLQV